MRLLLVLEDEEVPGETLLLLHLPQVQDVQLSICIPGKSDGI